MVVGAHGGACFTQGLGGVENIIVNVLHSQPKMGLQPPHTKRSWPYVGTSCCLRVPKNLLSSGSVEGGGGEVRGVGQHVHMLFVRAPLREHGPWHVLTGGGWKTMVAGGADHRENLPLVKEDLVPPVHLGLHQDRSPLNAQAILGGEGH